MTALARARSNCKVQTRPRQRGLPTLTNLQLSNSKKNLVLGPRWGLDTKIDWPTDRRSQHNFVFGLTVQSAKSVESYTYEK
jgi:hypothetical protein